MIYNPWEDPPRDNDIAFVSSEYAPEQEGESAPGTPIESALKVIDQQSTLIKQLMAALTNKNSTEL